MAAFYYGRGVRYLQRSVCPRFALGLSDRARRRSQDEPPPPAGRVSKKTTGAKNNTPSRRTFARSPSTRRDAVARGRKIVTGPFLL